VEVGIVIVPDLRVSVGSSVRIERRPRATDHGGPGLEAPRIEGLLCQWNGPRRWSGTAAVEVDRRPVLPEAAFPVLGMDRSYGRCGPPAARSEGDADGVRDWQRRRRPGARGSRVVRYP